jgi:hypothetical protein
MPDPQATADCRGERKRTGHSHGIPESLQVFAFIGALLHIAYAAVLLRRGSLGAHRDADTALCLSR